MNRGRATCGPAPRGRALLGWVDMPATGACVRWEATTLDGNKPPQARRLSTSGRTSRSGGAAAATGPASEPVASAHCRLRWFVATMSTAGAGCSLVPPRLPPAPGQGVPLAWESDATRRQLNRAPAPERGAAPEAAALFHWAAPRVCAIVLAPRQSRGPSQKRIPARCCLFLPRRAFLWRQVRAVWSRPSAPVLSARQEPDRPMPVGRNCRTGRDPVRAGSRHGCR